MNISAGLQVSLDRTLDPDRSLNKSSRTRLQGLFPILFGRLHPSVEVQPVIATLRLVSPSNPILNLLRPPRQRRSSGGQERRSEGGIELSDGERDRDGGTVAGVFSTGTRCRRTPTIRCVPRPRLLPELPYPAANDRGQGQPTPGSGFSGRSPARGGARREGAVVSAQPTPAEPQTVTSPFADRKARMGRDAPRSTGTPAIPVTAGPYAVASAAWRSGTAVGGTSVGGASVAGTLGLAGPPGFESRSLRTSL